IEDLKSQLRALLERPPAARSYPPPQMRELLAKFGDQMLEAVPILTNALALPDSETRLWAAGGLKVVIADYRETEWQDISRNAFALARPALAKILGSEDEPDLLRGITTAIFVPDMIWGGNGMLLTPTPMYSGEQEDVIAALRAPAKRGFRFSLADRVTQHLESHPQQGEACR